MARRRPEALQGVVKRRFILDCNRGPGGETATGVNQHTVQAQRILLLVGRGVVSDDVCLQEAMRDGDLECLILDISDAFFQILLRHSERRFFVAKYSGRYLVFLTIAQGSTNTP